MLQNLTLNNRFKLGFLINTTFMLFELAVGLFTGSLILIADAAHNLTDSVTLAIAWLGNRMAKRPADDNHSLGHGRISVLAAFINSVILVAVAVVIFFEAYQRFIHPVPLRGGVIAVVAVFGVIANGSVALLFRKSRSDLNVRAAYTNMAFDTIFSIAALLAGLLILATGKTWIDPLVSVGVGIGLLYAAFAILKQATHIFLEGVPESVDLEGVRQVILDSANIKDITNLSVWAISSDEYILFCRVVPKDTSYSKLDASTEALRKLLRSQGFAKVIIEVT
jgi:cobalt-zinc-cadmium efflux system protein